MNDNDLSSMLRGAVAELHSTTPVADIVKRGRAVRTQRRIPAVTGVLALAAGTALATTALTSHNHLGTHPTIALAAWTVTTPADGSIDVTINQLQDPAGLQSTLRAAGLPVTVSFSDPPLSSSCRPYNLSRDALRTVAYWTSDGDSSYVVINPAALPSGTGLSIFDQPGPGSRITSSVTPRTGSASSGSRTIGADTPAPSGITGPLAFGLVYASQDCTG